MAQLEKRSGSPQTTSSTRGLHAGEQPLYGGRSAVRYNEFNIVNGFKLHISRKNVRLNKIGTNMKNTPGRDFQYEPKKEHPKGAFYIHES